ncbi:MAG: hypothetical protein ACF8MJ_12285 [Phycisphaerales bacterium JB050]
MTARILTASALLTAMSSTVFAHGFDVWVNFENGQIVTGEADKTTSPVTFTPGVRAFEAEFGEIPGFPNLIDEPGFYTEHLAPGTGIGFNILDALRTWNGSDFNTIASQTMSIFGDPFPDGDVATTPASANEFVPGFQFIEADSNGFFDDHPTFQLNNQADGIYLLSLELFTDAEGIANSDPFYIVFGSNIDGSLGDDEAFEEQIEAAVDFVNSSIIPAPGTAGLLALASLAATRRRRA